MMDQMRDKGWEKEKSSMAGMQKVLEGQIFWVLIGL